MIIGGGLGQKELIQMVIFCGGQTPMKSLWSIKYVQILKYLFLQKIVIHLLLSNTLSSRCEFLMLYWKEMDYQMSDNNSIGNRIFL